MQILIRDLLKDLLHKFDCIFYISFLYSRNILFEMIFILTEPPAKVASTTFFIAIFFIVNAGALVRW